MAIFNSFLYVYQRVNHHQITIYSVFVGKPPTGSEYKVLPSRRYKVIASRAMNPLNRGLDNMNLAQAQTYGRYGW